MHKALGIEKLKSIYGNIAKRYDFQHALLTARTDQKGRRILVENSVKAGDKVLDCGAGTGSTGIMAARKVGQQGKVVLNKYIGVPLWPFLVFVIEKPAS